MAITNTMLLRILSFSLLVITIVSSQLNIATMEILANGYYHDAPLSVVTLFLNALHALCAAWCIIEASEGVRINDRVELRGSVLGWGVLVATYVGVVIEMAFRVRDRGHPVVVAALVLACIQLGMLVVGFLISDFKVFGRWLTFREGKIRLGQEGERMGSKWGFGYGATTDREPGIRVQVGQREEEVAENAKARRRLLA